jgi:hypothetical protein
MIIEKKKISELKAAPYNPRKSNEEQEKHLKASLTKFGVVEPIIWNKQSGYIVGGHFRIRELKKLGYKEVECVIVDLNEEDERELNIRLNANTGDFDWEALKTWDREQLEDWGLSLQKQSETEKISILDFEDIYYKPISEPKLKLHNCLDLTKFQKKIDFIDNLNLENETKELLKLFAYRFIKIDFESVANYYYFNANELEKTAIERLRLVLCDSGINGFIEDELLKIHNLIPDYND